MKIENLDDLYKATKEGTITDISIEHKFANSNNIQILSETLEKNPSIT